MKNKIQDFIHKIIDIEPTWHKLCSHECCPPVRSACQYLATPLPGIISYLHGPRLQVKHVTRGDAPLKDVKESKQSKVVCWDITAALCSLPWSGEMSLQLQFITETAHAFFKCSQAMTPFRKSWNTIIDLTILCIWTMSFLKKSSINCNTTILGRPDMFEQNTYENIV